MRPSERLKAKVFQMFDAIAADDQAEAARCAKQLPTMGPPSLISLHTDQWIEERGKDHSAIVEAIEANAVQHKQLADQAFDDAQERTKEGRLRQLRPHDADPQRQFKMVAAVDVMASLRGKNVLGVWMQPQEATGVNSVDDYKGELLLALSGRANGAEDVRFGG